MRTSLFCVLLSCLCIGTVSADKVKLTIHTVDGLKMDCKRTEEKDAVVIIHTNDGQQYIIRKEKISKVEEVIIPDEGIKPVLKEKKKPVVKMSVAEASRLYGVENAGFGVAAKGTSPYKPYLNNAPRSSRRSSGSSIRSRTTVFVNGEYAGEILDLGGNDLIYVMP